MRFIESNQSDSILVAIQPLYLRHAIVRRKKVLVAIHSHHSNSISEVVQLFSRGFSLIGSKLNQSECQQSSNLPNERKNTNMSTTPARSALDGSSMEALSSIKKALEDATGLLEALMINGSHEIIVDSPKNKPDSPLFPSDEREVVDLTYSPETDDDNENCGSSILFSNKIKTEEVVTASLAKSGTPDGMARSPSTTKVSPMSSALSKVDGLTRALKTINTNGGRRDSKGSCGLETIKVATESNRIGAVVYEVRAKPYRTAVKPVDNSEDKPWYDWKTFSVQQGILKLYRHESGQTQLVLRTPMNGIVKLNLAIRGNVFDLEKNIPLRKKGRTEVGQVSFFAHDAFEKERVMERFVLKVNRKELDNLYGKLVELGAQPKRRTG